MNKRTLANLYRQATQDDSAFPDAETLVALAHGERPADAERVIAEIAQSALQSDLLHFTRALEPASSALSREIAATFGEGDTRSPHRRAYAAPARTATGRWRNLRHVGIGLAAAMVAVVAIWSQQYRTASVSASMAEVAPAQDRIFAALDDRAVSRSQRDEIFDGSFKGDVIFRAN